MDVLPHELMTHIFTWVANSNARAVCRSFKGLIESRYENWKLYFAWRQYERLRRVQNPFQLHDEVVYKDEVFVITQVDAVVVRLVSERYNILNYVTIWWKMILEYPPGYYNRCAGFGLIKDVCIWNDTVYICMAGIEMELLDFVRMVHDSFKDYLSKPRCYDLALTYVYNTCSDQYRQRLQDLGYVKDMTDRYLLEYEFPSSKHFDNATRIKNIANT
jgi:hypothetical protein